MSEPSAVPLRSAVQALVAAQGTPLAGELERAIQAAVQGELSTRRPSAARRGLDRLLKVREGRVIPFQLSAFDALLAHYLLFVNVGDGRYGGRALAVIFSELLYVDAGWAELSGSTVSYHDHWTPVPETGLAAWFRPAGRVAWQNELSCLTQLRPEAGFVVGDAVAIHIHLRDMPQWGLRQLATPGRAEWKVLLEGQGSQGGQRQPLRAVTVDVQPGERLLRVVLKSPEAVIQVTAAARVPGATLWLEHGPHRVVAQLPAFDDEGATAPAWVSCIDDRRIFLWSERDPLISLPSEVVRQSVAQFRWFAPTHCRGSVDAH
jgi:hypothetical protein